MQLSANSIDCDDHDSRSILLVYRVWVDLSAGVFDFLL